MSRGTAAQRARRSRARLTAEDQRWARIRAARARRRRRTALVLILLLILGAIAAACGVREGRVIEKDHDKAWTQHTTRTVYDQVNCRNVKTSTGTGTTRRTTTTQKCDRRAREVPQTIRHPESWELTLRNDEGETGEVSVSRSTYDRVDIGDYYSAK